MRSTHSIIVAGGLALCLVVAGGRPVAAADLLVESETLSLPGDAQTGQPKVAFQRGHEIVLDPGDGEHRLDVAFPGTAEIRIETITALVHVPTGQMPWLYIETHGADGTVVRHDVALQSMGSYVSAGTAYTRFSATHYVRLFSQSVRDAVPPLTEITWSVGRTGGSSKGYSLTNFSMSGYRVAGPLPK